MRRFLIISAALFLFAATGCQDKQTPDPTSDDLRITSFKITNAGLSEDQSIDGVINGTNISLIVPYETVDSLVVSSTSPENVKVFPSNGTKWDMTGKTTTFVAFSGVKMVEYQVSVTKAEPTVPTVMAVGFSSEAGVALGSTINVMKRLITVRIYEGLSPKAVINSIDMLPVGSTAKIDGDNAVGKTLDFTDMNSTYTIVGQQGANTVNWTIKAVVIPGGIDLTKPVSVLASSTTFLASLNNGNVRDAVVSGSDIFWTSRVSGNFVYCNSIQNMAAGKDDTTVELQAPAGGYTGGTFAVSAIASANGHIYVTNMGMNSLTSELKVYHWADKNSQGQMIYAFTHPVNNIRLGDAITVDLDDNGNGRLFAADFNNTKSFYVFPVTNYTTIGAPTRVVFATSSPVNGQYVTVNRVPWTANQYVITGGDMGLVVGTLSTDNTTFNTLAEIERTSAIPMRTYQAKFFEIGGGRYMAYTYATDAAPSREARLWIVNLSKYVDMTDAFNDLNTSTVLNAFPAPNNQQLWALEYGKKTDAAAGTTYGATSFEIAADGSAVNVFSFSCQRGYTLQKFNKN